MYLDFAPAAGGSVQIRSADTTVFDLDIYICLFPCLKGSIYKAKRMTEADRCV
jgi:hypothetical protein